LTLSLLLVWVGGCGKDAPPDLTAPEITVIGDNPLTVGVGNAFNDPGARATDDVDGAVTVVSSGEVDTSALGTYTIAYSATDRAGNTSRAERTVHVVDDTPPVVTLNGSAEDTVVSGQAYVELGATASDNVDGVLPVDVTGSVDTTQPGTYTVTYSATDAAGNEGSATRTITVSERQYWLVVETFGQGSVTVEGQEAAFDCGESGRCRASFTAGTEVFLTTTTNAGWRIDAWFGCDPAGVDRCRVDIDRDREVTAAFVSTDPVEFEEEVVFLTRAQTEEILSYNRESGTLRLAPGSVGSNVTPGAVLVSDFESPTDLSHPPFLRVVGVWADDDDPPSPIRVVGVPASLDDVVKSGTLKFAGDSMLGPLSELDATSGTGALSRMSDAGGTRSADAMATECTEISLDRTSVNLDFEFGAPIEGAVTGQLGLGYDGLTYFAKVDGVSELFARLAFEPDIAADVRVNLRLEQVIDLDCPKCPAFEIPLVVQFVPKPPTVLVLKGGLELRPAISADGLIEVGVDLAQRACLTVRCGNGCTFETDVVPLRNVWTPTLFAPDSFRVELGGAAKLSYGPEWLVAGAALSAGVVVFHGADFRPDDDDETCWRANPYWGFAGTMGTEVRVGLWEYGPELEFLRSERPLESFYVACETTEPARPSDPPSTVTPSTLTVHPPSAHGTLRLTWVVGESDPADTSYEIHRDGRYLATPTTPEYVDNTLGDGEQHCYVVRSVSGNVEAISDQACGQTLPATRDPPPPPADVRVTAKNGWSISVAWDASPDVESGTSYRVNFDGGDVSGWQSALGTQAVVSGLRPGTRYCIDVQAAQDGYLSARTSEVCEWTTQQVLGGDDFPDSRDQATLLVWEDEDDWETETRTSYMETEEDVDWFFVRIPSGPEGELQIEFDVRYRDVLQLEAYKGTSGRKLLILETRDLQDEEGSLDVEPGDEVFVKVFHDPSFVSLAEVDNDQYWVEFVFDPASNDDDPVVNCPSPRTVKAGSQVVLSCTATDDQGISTWAWRQTVGQVPFSGADTAAIRFTAPSVSASTRLEFSVTVTDGASDSPRSSTTTVQVTVVPNVAPMADAGSDQSVAAGTSVTLSGAGSSDPDGTIASYAWMQTAGSDVGLGDAGSQQVSFTAPDVATRETLTFRLTVTDDDGDTDTDTVNVTVRPVTANAPPVAEAGEDQTVDAGASVTLSGAGSSDSDGTITGYAWTQTAGSTVQLGGGDTVRATFTAPNPSAQETLTFRLTVTDDDGATDSDTVDVTVRPVAGNVAPVANAGEDQTVEPGASVTLSGAGSSDSDGTITGYAWTQTAGSTVQLGGGNTVQASFTAPNVSARETLTFRLTVTDDDAATDSDTVNVTVQPAAANIPPVADAGRDQSRAEGALVTLSGAGSSDADGDIAEYAWTQTAGTSVVLTGTDTVRASFTAPYVTTQETLTFRLAVTDDDGATASDTVSVTLQSTTGSQAANIPDATLRRAIESVLGKSEGDTITRSEMGQIAMLRSEGVAQIAGLEYATNMTNLNIFEGTISDLGPITNLISLSAVNFARNSITDISPLGNLTNMGLLYLSTNSISDIASLEDLVHLSNLRLEHNSISDISPLVNNSGLGTGDYVNLISNPLSTQSIVVHIPALEARGVTVRR